jgi:hypothetical protein
LMPFGRQPIELPPLLARDYLAISISLQTSRGTERVC